MPVWELWLTVHVFLFSVFCDFPEMHSKKKEKKKKNEIAPLLVLIISLSLMFLLTNAHNWVKQSCVVSVK